MTVSPDVHVQLDDRIRLMSALLAATPYPDRIQAQKPHGTHAHARVTRKFVSTHQNHNAARILDTLLMQDAPLEALYTFIMRITLPDFSAEQVPQWVPPQWLGAIKDFYIQSQLPRLWQNENENEQWQAAVTELSKVLEGFALKPFLEQFVGEIQDTFTIVPNICYPSNVEIGVLHGRELICITPPRLAWGDSPPWTFDEDPAHIYRAAITQFGRLLLVSHLAPHQDRVNEASKVALPIHDEFKKQYPQWQEQFIQLFVRGAVAIYLEDHVSKAEANAYVLMERKVNNMTILPSIVTVLRRYLNERENGRYATLSDFLPVFAKQLRVTARIVNL